MSGTKFTKPLAIVLKEHSVCTSPQVAQSVKDLAHLYVHMLFSYVNIRIPDPSCSLVFDEYSLSAPISIFYTLGPPAKHSTPVSAARKSRLCGSCGLLDTNNHGTLTSGSLVLGSRSRSSATGNWIRMLYSGDVLEKKVPGFVFMI